MFKGEANTNGRPKGSLNSVTAKMKQTVSNILEENTSEFKERLSSLSDADYVKHYISLLRFVMPTQKAILEQEPTPEQPIFIIEVLDGDGNII
jgi:formate dehydrogenase maturation protein FdhE